MQALLRSLRSSQQLKFEAVESNYRCIPAPHSPAFLTAPYYCLGAGSEGHFSHLPDVEAGLVDLTLAQLQRSSDAVQLDFAGQVCALG